jgi:hypothetical protein
VRLPTSSERARPVVFPSFFPSIPHPPHLPSRVGLHRALGACSPRADRTPEEAPLGPAPSEP